MVEKDKCMYYPHKRGRQTSTKQYVRVIRGTGEEFYGGKGVTQHGGESNGKTHMSKDKVLDGISPPDEHNIIIRA